MLIATNGFVELARGLRETFDMFWQTFWALAGGFLLSGFLQEFAPRQRIERTLGNHRFGAILRATTFGAVSSSCSYAASALARRLFLLGADFISSLVFMVASTNLVIELGVVVAVLIGWQFVVGEVAGGLAMIAIMAIIGSVILSRRITGTLRSASTESNSDHEHGHSSIASAGFRSRISSAASFGIADLLMLKKEIVGGFLAAGLLSEIVPGSVWSHIFFHGHGELAVVENALVGPIVAFIACVCSVGNVPLAATLWHEGIAFPGVVSFILADLLAAPLILTYRRYYGTKITTRVVVLLYLAMVGGSLATSGLFSVVGATPVNRQLLVFTSGAKFDATGVLNIVAAILLVLAGFAKRRCDRKGDDATDTATDPICHMRVKKTDAPRFVSLGGDTFYFCSDGCADRFALAREIELQQ